MKPGDKIPIILEVVEPAKDGEVIKDYQGQDFELSNKRGNKWWAIPKGTTGPRILVCSDCGDDTESGAIKRKAIVDLLECGVGL